MPIVDINGTLVDFPDDMNPDQLKGAVFIAANKLSSGYWKSALMGGNVKPQTIPQKIDYGARKGLQILFDAANYPFEKTGEAIRTAIGGGPMRPSSLATDIGMATPNQQPPMNFLSVPRKAIEASVVGLSKLSPSAARNEFNRTSTTPVESATDMALAFAGQKYAPNITNAPINAASKIMGKTLQGVGWSGKKALGLATGTSEEAINARLKNPSSIENAPPIEDISQNFTKTINDLKDQVANESNQAFDSLLKLKSEPQSKVINMLRGLKTQLRIKGGGALGSENQSAMNSVDNFMEGLKNIKQKGIAPDLAQMFDQQQLKQVVQAADTMSDWGNPNPNKTAQVFRQFRGKLNSYLRTENPGYAEIMDPISKKMDLIDNLSQSFALRKEGGNFVPSDTTASKFPLYLKEGKSFTQGKLEKLKNMTGQDFLMQARNAKLAKEFEPGMRAQGSRRTLVGSIIGGAIGKFTGNPTLGATVGAATGYLLDTQGGPIAAKIIDFISANQPNIKPETLNALKQALPAILASQVTNKGR